MALSPAGREGGVAARPRPTVGMVPPDRRLTTALRRFRKAWLSNAWGDVLSGIAVALALIPEAISFSVIAGVDPRVGLYASFSMAVVISLTGGRPAMISAATGSMSVVVGPLVHAHGLQYLLAATVLTGLIQVVLGVLGAGRLMRFIPRPVMSGFLNALAIMIFTAQLHNFIGKTWKIWPMIAAGLLIIYLLPRATRVVPATLVAVIGIALITNGLHIRVPNVGDAGALPGSLPSFALPHVPYDFHTLRIILPYAATLSVVGLLESLLTAQVIDDATDTTSNKDVESRGQGYSNIVTGFLGGMAGCALIGESTINIKSGGRTRLSTLVSGIFLLVLVTVLRHPVSRIPMAALVSVMVMVSITTFDWSSITPHALRTVPFSETASMLVTVGIVLATHNLAIGVLVGSLLGAVFFARRVAHLVNVDSVVEAGGGTRLYRLTGELFFASTNELEHSFDFTDPTPKVVIDLSAAHLWDTSAVAALDAVAAKFGERGINVEIVGLNPASSKLRDRTRREYVPTGG
jgi:SulP family sulfate permease